jgi:hypothetical protein
MGGKMITHINLVEFENKIEYIKVYSDIYDGEYRDRFISVLYNISPDNTSLVHEAETSVYKGIDVQAHIYPG